SDGLFYFGRGGAKARRRGGLRDGSNSVNAAGCWLLVFLGSQLIWRAEPPGKPTKTHHRSSLSYSEPLQPQQLGSPSRLRAFASKKNKQPYSPSSGATLASGSSPPAADTTGSGRCRGKELVSAGLKRRVVASQPKCCTWMASFPISTMLKTEARFPRVREVCVL